MVKKIKYFDEVKQFRQQQRQNDFTVVLRIKKETPVTVSLTKKEN
jgi:hypothetical protein